MAKYDISLEGANSLRELAQKLNTSMSLIINANQVLQRNIASVMDELGIFGTEIWELTLQSRAALSDSEESIETLTSSLYQLSDLLEELVNLGIDGVDSPALKTGMSGSSPARNAHRDTPISYNEFGVQSMESISNWIGFVNPDPYLDFRRQVNCGQCALAVFHRLNGDTTATAGLGTFSITEMERLTGRKQTAMTPEQIKTYLISQGPGAHAVVGVDRASGSGHWLNAYYDGYEVYAIDGQSGDVEGWPPNCGDVVYWDVGI